MIGYLNADGTATVTGSALPVDAAAVACAHVEELARAAKRAGHPGRIGPLRADIYLSLLDGRWQHCTRDQIIADLLTNATSDTDDGADPDNPTDPDQQGDPVVGGDAVTGGVSDGAVADGAPDGGTPIHRAAAGVDGDGAGTHQDRAPAAGLPSTVPEAAAQPTRRVGVEVRAGLSTLLGHDRHPGEIAGWGPVSAEVARSVVVAQRGAEWRYALTDPAGQLLLAGITRRRPHRTAPGSTVGGLPPSRGGIVELHLPATLLTELAADVDACGEWAPVVADLAAQHTRYQECGRRGPAGQDPAARFAGVALRRHVQVRDRSCVYPGCRCTARSADLDHTVDHGYGGLTTEGNSGPLYRHDHRLKHVGRWRLHQSEPGNFTWVSPLGRTYHTQPPPITDDLPEPRPRPDHPDYPLFATADDEQPILDRPPPQPDPPPPDPDEPPPF